MKQNTKKLLGKRIREIRKARKLTQETLAEQAGIEPASLSNIERGKNYPNSETLEKIANALEVEPYEMYLFDHLIKPTTEEMLQAINDTLAGDEELTQKMYFLLRTLRP